MRVKQYKEFGGKKLKENNLILQVLPTIIKHFDDNKISYWIIVFNNNILYSIESNTRDDFNKDIFEWIILYDLVEC